MTIYTWPVMNRRNPSQLDWALVSNTQSFESPLSGAVQTVEMPGARWRASFTFQALDASDAGILRAHLARLRGRSGRFYLHNMARSVPTGSAAGSPLVNGAGQSGTTLITDGWTPNQTGALKAGDFFGVNGELKMVVADVNSDGSGNATITFEPPLRGTPADNLQVITNKPTAIFRLDEDVARWVTSAPALDTISISATETW
jgi:hypothetical protein